MKSRKRKLLKLGIMCLMPLLALLITISNSYAYYLNDDGNLVSQNLLNMQYDNTINGVNLKLDSTSVIINGNNTSSSDLYYYVNLFNDLEINHTYTLSFDTNISIIYDAWVNGNRYMCADNQSLTITLTNELKNAGWRFVVHSGYYNNSVVNIMLNDGTSALNYEPYGIWYNSENAYQPMNVAFNDCRVELLNYNVSTHNVVSSTNLTISNSQLITLDNIPSLKTIIENDEDTRYGLKFYLNNPINYILNFQMNNSVYQVNVVLSNSVTGQSYSFEYGSNIENYNLVCNTNNNYYDTILYYTLLSPDYSYFSMYVNTDSASFNSGYGVGYTEGYDEGFDSGHLIGYNTGIHENGEYQRGYNDGIQQDLASSGFRTLITTILSYPVNMVRESLNFEFMGIHVASIVLFIVSLGIVAFVIKRFKD